MIVFVIQVVGDIMSILTTLKQKLENSKNVIDKIEAIKVDALVQDERLNLCLSCEHLFKPTNTCKKCGCFMTAKTWLKNASCPLKKW